MLCRAKVNLTLHVGAPLRAGRWTGYHPVDSLVVFADIGDRLSLEPGHGSHHLSIEGPFSEGLTARADNLVIQALERCGAPATHATLDKRIPVSAGLGGGSANAAAVLRRFDPDGQVDAAALGADVPVCRLSRTARMSGIGEIVEPLPGLGRIPALLVNPRVPVSTAEMFRRYDAVAPPETPRATRSVGSLLERAKAGTNDLQETAIALAPVIADVIDAVAMQPGCTLSRMSGSGASCFGLFDTMDRAREAAVALSDTGWWVVHAWLGDGEAAP